MRHAGEIAVQRRTGVRLAEHGSARVRAEIPEVAARFLESQRMVVIGTEDREGRVWAAPLTGRPGFVAPSGDLTILVDAVPVAPLAGVFDVEHDIGMLAVEPWTRRRMRVNGRARRDGDHLIVRTEQVYSNCPKYLQKRTIVEDLEPGERTSRSGDRLSEAQREWIRAADTFFIATHAPGLGSDVSHRGGNPGFVEVVDDRRLVWPDYAGNLMYMTLGNLELNPAAGLLFLDWATGDALHLTGRARVDWDPREVPGAQRLVQFDVEHVLEAGGASPLRWAFEEYSRFNSPVRGA
ncbi:pyridoxamine 5'-phosphate oxidase family protein [Microbispora bryophytorum]|uniref:pyridoxamine 5'-phosphate oxidase family protein n=1 Tax=Microbispora bryophytorum TaxID=1460882 RepID=UPI0033E78971